MPGVFDRLVGQEAAEEQLVAAAYAAREGGALASYASAIDGPARQPEGSAMVHAWLFTGPPGSGRSIAAVCFAAALQCQSEYETPGCGYCHACTTTLAGTHADVRRVIPEGLSINVAEMRAIVQTASRRPSTGRWQIVVVEDADRLTEGAANALLKVVEEPPPQTVFLLCAPTPDPSDIAVTLRSRCRHIVLRTPSVEAVAAVLERRDKLAPETAQWAASIAGGHVGRARRLATDATARERRKNALDIAAAAGGPGAYAAADALVKAAREESHALSAERDEKETEELKTALGAGGTGKGAAGALRGSAGVLKDLEKRQKSRATRAERDALDRALIDLAGLYRDALLHTLGAQVPHTHPDMAPQIDALARRSSAEGLLKGMDAILNCREALATNVKPDFAVTAMIAQLGALQR